MIVVVECESCLSRFRVKKSLLVGTYAIRFRCRACGGVIVVRNPEMHKIAEVPSPPPSLPPVSPEVAAKPPSHPKSEKVGAAGTPASSDTYVEPETPTTGDMPAPSNSFIEPEMPTVASKPASPGEAGPAAARLEDLVPNSPEGTVHARRGRIGRTVAAKRVEKETRPKKVNKPAWVIGILSFLAAVGILLYVNGVFDFGIFDPDSRSPGRESSPTGSSVAARSSSKSAYEVKNLDSYFLRKAVAGDLFVITGTVKNVGKAATRGIRLRAILFEKDDKVFMEQTSIAGNYIDKDSLPYLTRRAINVHLSRRSGEWTGNDDIPPGNSVSFVVVCFDPPGVVESYEVLATDAGL